MNSRYQNRWLIIFLSLWINTLLFLGCKKENSLNVEEKFNLRHKGAEMPIWIRGNLASGKLILFLHGGPGDCAMCYQYYLQDIEKDFAVAYWDQRIAGSSSGKVDPKTLTYQQFGEDAYYVVKLLKEKLPGTRIYLLGHSFGVELAWQFLSIENNQKMVNGFIAVNGTFSTYRWLYQMREWVLREGVIQNNHAAIDFANSNPVTNESLKTIDWPQLYKYMLELGGNPVSVYDDKKFVINYLFVSPNTPLGQFTHAKAYNYYSQYEIRSFDKSESLKNISIPIALFWGKKDGVVPIEVGHETKSLLTSTSTSLVSFDNSWHEPFITEKISLLQRSKILSNNIKNFLNMLTVDVKQLIRNRF